MTFTTAAFFTRIRISPKPVKLRTLSTARMIWRAVGDWTSILVTISFIEKQNAGSVKSVS